MFKIFVFGKIIAKVPLGKLDKLSLVKARDNLFIRFLSEAFDEYFLEIVKLNLESLFESIINKMLKKLLDIFLPNFFI